MTRKDAQAESLRRARESVDDQAARIYKLAGAIVAKIHATTKEDQINWGHVGSMGYTMTKLLEIAEHWGIEP